MCAENSRTVKIQALARVLQSSTKIQNCDVFNVPAGVQIFKNHTFHSGFTAKFARTQFAPLRNSTKKYESGFVGFGKRVCQGSDARQTMLSSHFLTFQTRRNSGLARGPMIAQTTIIVRLLLFEALVSQGSEPWGSYHLIGPRINSHS